MKRQSLRIISLACLLTVICFMPTLATAQSSPKQLKIAAYNLWNMFDIYDDPYSQDESTRVKPRKEIVAIAQTLKAINADVVGCTEIENVHLLKAMTHDFLPDAGYEYFATTDSNSGRGMQIGVMSKLPILSVTSHKFRKLELPGNRKSWQFARDLMQVQIQVTDKQILELFIVHFKSKRSVSGDPKSNQWRLAEAAMARQIIEETHKAHPDHWIAIIGDFNDTPGSDPIQHLLASPPGSSQSPKLLFDAHDHLPDDKRITYLKKPYRSTIDFIFTGPQLIKQLNRKQTGLLADKSKLAGSDHAPIFATFNLN